MVFENTEFVGPVKKLNFAFYKLAVAQSEFVKVFLCFFLKVISLNFAFFQMLANIFFGVGMPC